jgi:predicted DNA-binding protein
MSTKTTTIRFNDEEQKLLDLYMEFQDQPLSTVIKESLFEDIADFFDSSLFEKALESNNQHPKRYSTKELLDELGLK